MKQGRLQVVEPPIPLSANRPYEVDALRQWVLYTAKAPSTEGVR